MVERRVLGDENGFESSWGFAAEPFASNFEQLKKTLLFWYTKGLIPNPPNFGFFSDFRLLFVMRQGCTLFKSGGYLVVHQRIWSAW
jgi:hypothetical protein